MKRINDILNFKSLIPYRVKKHFFAQQKKDIMQKIQGEQEANMPKNIPYTIIPSFFEKQKQSILNQIQIEEQLLRKTKVPYKVSKNYFPFLTQSLLGKTEQTNVKQQFTFVRKRIISVVSVASVFVFLFVSYWFYDGSKTSAFSGMTEAGFSIPKEVHEQDMTIIVKTELAEEFQTCFAPSTSDEICWEHNDCFEGNEDLVVEITDNISLADIICEH